MISKKSFQVTFYIIYINFRFEYFTGYVALLGYKVIHFSMIYLMQNSLHVEHV